MSQHYTRNVTSVSHWCNVCGRLTMHRVDGGRLGRCVEEHAKAKKPEPENKQQGLFEK